ncbi:hypothetical protein FB45DRAFT_1010120 [Roridomyces roridus]|uniref:Uncharacterized protein n=1 Tax=Roridomyces roridus TaxID=1738132 RepID=A0AAD7B4Q6_9AGAR|nr:hypothetical protein FB45DRAFT_1010120 [Roridomyces roridus]
MEQVRKVECEGISYAPWKRNSPQVTCARFESEGVGEGRRGYAHVELKPVAAVQGSSDLEGAGILTHARKACVEIEGRGAEVLIRIRSAFNLGERSVLVAGRASSSRGGRGEIGRRWREKTRGDIHMITPSLGQIRNRNGPLVDHPGPEIQLNINQA